MKRLLVVAWAACVKWLSVIEWMPVVVWAARVEWRHGCLQIADPVPPNQTPTCAASRKRPQACLEPRLHHGPKQLLARIFHLDELREMVRHTLANDKGKAYHHLIEACLGQTMSLSQDISYDVELSLASSTARAGTSQGLATLNKGPFRETE